jgi:uncharacterized protein involved in outer membrane biogenesis
MRNFASRFPPAACIVIALAVVGAVVIILFDWNWLRGPISSYLSTKFGRPVAINGNLRGEFSLNHTIADDVTLANTAAERPMMARLAGSRFVWTCFRCSARLLPR